MNTNKKRVAICFYGQTRTFQVIDQTYKNLSHDEIEFDFFVSTWDDFKGKQKFNFCKEKEFIKPNIIDFINNTDRASYTIYRVNSLKNNYEIKNNFIYDYTMWVRSEILFSQSILRDFFNEKINSHKPLELNIHSDIEKVEGLDYLAADYYFMGPSLSFDLYATGWKSYYKRNDKNFDQGRHGGHNYHAFTIKNNNFKTVPVNLYHEFQFSKLDKREV